MRTAISNLSLLEPRSLKEALKILRDTEATPMAGCTDLYVSLNFGTLKSSRFVNIWNLDSLRNIREEKTVLSIGALCTYTRLIQSPIVQKRLPMLVSASKAVGGAQIQNRGTIGGNIANASPAGDTLPVLAVAGAVVVLGSADGERRVPFNAFYTGYRQSVMRKDELILAVEIPRLSAAQWFRKVGTRQAQAISKVVMAALKNGKEARIALGSVGPTVVRLSKTEAVLNSGGTIQDGQEALRREIQPIDDLRSTARYRREVAANLLALWWGDG